MTSDPEDKAKVNLLGKVFNIGRLERKQIKEKYKSPEYRPPKPENKSLQMQSMGAINLAIIALCISLFAISYFFTVYRFNTGWGFLIPFLLSLALSVKLFTFVTDKAEEMNVDAFTAPILTKGLVLLMLVVGFMGFMDFIASLANWNSIDEAGLEDDAWLFFYYISSLLIIFVPFMALMQKSDEAAERAKMVSWRVWKARHEVERESNHRKLWEKAQKYEAHDLLDKAERIWSDLGEKEEIERLTRLRVEYSQIMFKQRIHDLTAKGIDTTELEKALRKTGADIEK